MTLRNHRKMSFSRPTNASLRVGPLRRKWSPVSGQTVILIWLLSIVINGVLFVWYANTSIAHVYPDGNGNWLSGLLHGYFALPSFVVSWFNHDITIYQSPNNGFWYNFWFILGIGVFANSVRS